MEFNDQVTPSWQDYYSQMYNPNAPGLAPTQAQNRDWYNSWLSMYMPNAFQAALLNYQNEYERPVNQMLRYQEAGLNPYSYQHQQSASGSQGAQIKPSTDNQEMSLKRVQTMMNGVSSLSSALGAAKEIYDYINFGVEQQGYRTSILASQSEAANYEALLKGSDLNWQRYWNQGVDLPVTYYDSNGQKHDFLPSHSPRAKYMQESTSRLRAQIAQLSYMVNTLYPSQTAANEARAALTNYLQEIEAGKNQAVLNINTGHKDLDAVLRFIVYLLKDNSGNLIGLLK